MFKNILCSNYNINKRYYIGGHELRHTHVHPLKAHDNLVRLRSKAPFNKYKSSWILTYFAQTYSFVPLRDAFIDNILKERVWHRTKENSNPSPNQLKYREFALLKELNNESNKSFIDIDKKYDLNEGTSRYAYRSLKSQGIIIRPTITMTNLGIKYIGIILISNIYYKKIQENRYKFLFELMEYGKISNKYCLTGNIGTPNGAILFLPIMEDGDMDTAVAKIEKELQGSIVKSLIITNIIIGSLCYRRFDSNYSRQYGLLVESNKIEPKTLVLYE